MSTNQLTIALTGGIGAGKTTVASLFEKQGASIIDADAIAKNCVAPPSEILASVIHEFGNSLLQADGTLDRTALRNMIFNDALAKQRLEAILHPPIRAAIYTARQQAKGLYVILVIPLLTHKEQFPNVQRVLVVDCPETVQISRTSHRDACTAAEVQAIMQQQSSRDQRLAFADDIIMNDQDYAYLDQQVQDLHQQYLHLS